MAQRTRLRDFQEYLAGRLASAAQGGAGAAWLGVEAGEANWLVDLADGGEVVQAPRLHPVPLTRPWFAGLANIRGTLYAVTDFPAFCGAPRTTLNTSARLLLIGSRHGSNAALLVPRLLGLKNPADFSLADPTPGVPPWGAQCLLDPQGRSWHKLGVRELLADAQFMTIGV